MRVDRRNPFQQRSQNVPKRNKDDEEPAFDPTAPVDIPDADEAGMTHPGGEAYDDDEPLWGDVERREFEDVLGIAVAFLDATFIKSSYNDGDFVVMRLRDLTTGEEFTTRSGSWVLVDRLRAAKSATPSKLPFKGRIARMESQRNPGKSFYTIVPVASS
jgi:hypothetical protein